MDIVIEHLDRLVWFAWLPLLMLANLWAAFARRNGLRRFASLELRRRIQSQISWTSRTFRVVVLFLSVLLLTLALLDFRWGKIEHQVPQKGIDVIFAVDVSRSMLAADVAPSRLERARQQIREMLSMMRGDRAGLIAFAGQAKRKVPLTTNYRDFRQALNELSPISVEVGGSHLVAALNTAAESFLDKTADHKAIVIFSDGDEQDASVQPAERAKQLYEKQGIRIFTVGLGDTDQGARIVQSQSEAGVRYLEYNGQQVWSKLQEQTLQDVAQAGQGAYIPAGTKQVDMKQVYTRFIGSIAQREFEVKTLVTYVPRFQWFASFALVLILIYHWIPESRSKAIHVGL
ncbi:MAG: VWA domain-containing protein [Planctomycetales bacterium]|nr:VWA domain-containing protein [Planctomycetales bacterium]